MLRRKLLLVYLILLATLVVIIGCDKMKDKPMGDAPKAEASFDPESARAAIDASNAEFCKAMMASDSIGLIARYDDNSKVFPPNMEPVVGTKEIKKFMMHPMDMKMTDFKIEAVSLSGTEDNLIEIGNYSITGEKGAMDKGKFIAIWKKAGDSWKIQTEIWNSNMPPLPPPPAPAEKK
ncbi:MULTISPECIES: YybH family protein [Flavobacterium]|uniref:YybH family protein n=1 Tax=Flavobacterium TaxID=237 RepID=UPI001FCAB3CE|nr:MULTISPECIES: nuclear transport factor 2 family protein [Flavobacterium]UOK41306.1 nuclear transport factor 2 family protein [Flavobacterium enshiense]